MDQTHVVLRHRRIDGLTPLLAESRHLLLDSGGFAEGTGHQGAALERLQRIRVQVVLKHLI